MNTLYHDIVIDLNHMGFPESVTVKQYDDQIPHVRVELRQNGAKYMIPSGTTLRMQGTKPDGTHFMYDVIRTDDGRVDCPLTNQILAAAGPILTEVCMTDTTGELTTFNFYIFAQKAALSREEIESSDDYESIDKIREETQKYKEQAEAAKTAAEAAKEAATKSANTATQQAQTAQLEAQKVKQIVAGNEAYTKTESDLKYTVAPRKEASSNTGELKLTDADEGLSYLALQGNSEQYTATGTNLFDVKQLVKNMQALAPNGITIGQDDYGEFMRIENGGWNAKRCLEITNDATKSYKIGCKAKYVSGNGKVLVMTIQYKDGTHGSTNFVYNETVYTEMSAIIPVGKEVDYIYFTFNTAGNYYDILLDSFYLYPEDAPSTEKPTGGYGTPSPEYPSEVRSVGDIPKDVNGVEIRNILDEDTLKNPDNWSVQDKNLYYVKLSPSVAKLFGAGYKISTISFSWQSVLYLSETLTAGANIRITLINNAGGVQSGSYTFPSVDPIYLIAYNRNGDAIEKAQFIDELFKCYKLMLTEAAEIDEYRPYIGENNGLVKLESIGVNHADTGDGPVYIAGVNRIEVNTWTPRKIVLTQKNKDTSYAYLKLNVERGKDYTFYCKVKVEVIDGAATDGVTSIGFRQYPPGGAMYGQTMLSQDGQYKDIYNTVGVIPDDVPNIAFMLYLNSSSASNGNIKMTIDDLMVVEGTKTLQEMQALKFQPYYQQITWIPLKEPLRKIANSGRYLDSLDKDGNVTQMIVKKILNKSGVGYNGEALSGKGVQGVISLGTSNVKFDVETQYSNQALSNVFKTSYGNIINYQVLYRSSVGANVSVAFIVDKNILSSNNKEGFLNYLMTLPDIAEYFVLDTPVTYQIPAVYIETHDPETNVRCLNKVKPSDMTLDYKLAMSSLIKRLEALEEKTVQEV